MLNCIYITCRKIQFEHLNLTGHLVQDMKQNTTLDNKAPWIETQKEDDICIIYSMLFVRFFKFAAN